MGNSSCPSCQVNDAGRVSKNELSRASRKRSVLKGIMLPALAFALNWLLSNGAASFIKGCSFIFSTSPRENLLFWPMFSLVIVLVTEIKSKPSLRGFFSSRSLSILMYNCALASNKKTPMHNPA